MIHKTGSKLIVLFRFLLAALLVFSLSRLIFLLYNFSVFNTESSSDILFAFIAGLRFDLTAVLYLNLALILLYLEPSNFASKRAGRILSGIFFILPNSVALLANLADTGWFSYTLKRTTSDWFNITGLGRDLMNTAPDMISDNVILLILLAFLVFFLIYFNKLNQLDSKQSKLRTRIIIERISILLISIPLIIFGIRGGLQYRPIGLMTAAQNSNARLAPLVLNTPFTLMRTLGKQELIDPRYFQQSQLDKIINLHHDFSANGDFREKNIVLIILESFSSEYIGFLNNGDGYTPFLDSLMGHSTVFTNAYANSKRSIEGVPAIVSGIPALMSEAYITSTYAGNRINSIASLLNKVNYKTVFYHGGLNGTMGFDNFARMAGYDRYKGKQEYPRQDDFDGNWGIYDGPYLSYFSDEINKMQEPFLATVMTLSSHHPYSIPKEFKNRFEKGPSEILESIQYADYSLKEFFQKSAKQEWYKNTYFILTADHTGPAYSPFYQTKTGSYKVPIIFFDPSNSKGVKISHVVQHADILPGIMDTLNYPYSFNAFGKSLFKANQKSIAFNYQNDLYQAISKKRLLQFDGENVIAYFDIENDSLLQNNIHHNKDEYFDETLLSLKAFIQKFNSTLIHNSLIKND